MERQIISAADTRRKCEASNWTIKVSNGFRESFQHSHSHALVHIGSMWTLDFTIIAFFGEARMAATSSIVKHLILI